MDDTSSSSNSSASDVYETEYMRHLMHKEDEEEFNNQNKVHAQELAALKPRSSKTLNRYQPHQMTPTSKAQITQVCKDLQKITGELILCACEQIHASEKHLNLLRVSTLLRAKLHAAGHENNELLQNNLQALKYAKRLGPNRAERIFRRQDLAKKKQEEKPVKEKKPRKPRAKKEKPAPVVRVCNPANIAATDF